MGFKKIRKAEVAHIGRLPVHQYEDRDGAQTSVGVDEMVQVVLRVLDGPDYGREIRVTMTRTEAMEHIRRVSDAVQATRDAELDGGA